MSMILSLHVKSCWEPTFQFQQKVQNSKRDKIVFHGWNNTFLLFWKDVKLRLYLIWEIRLYETFRNLAMVSFDEFPHRCKKSWALIGSAPQGIMVHDSWSMHRFENSPYLDRHLDWAVSIEPFDLISVIFFGLFLWSLHIYRFYISKGIS